MFQNYQDKLRNFLNSFSQGAKNFVGNVQSAFQPTISPLASPSAPAPSFGQVLKSAAMYSNPLTGFFYSKQEAIPKIQSAISNWSTQHPTASGIIGKAEPAYNAVQSAVRSIPENPISLDFVRKSVAQNPLINTGIKPIDVAGNTAVNLATGFGTGLLESIANAPTKLIYNAYRLPQEQTLQGTIGRTAGIVEPLFTMAAPKQIAGGVVRAAEQPVWGNRLLGAIKTGAGEGAQFGGVFGALGGLQENATAPSVGEQFVRSIPSTVIGAGVGAGLGGAMGAGGYAVKSTIDAIQGEARTTAKEMTKGILQLPESKRPIWVKKLNHDPQKMEEYLYQYYRNRIGQRGAIDLNAKIGQPGLSPQDKVKQSPEAIPPEVLGEQGRPPLPEQQGLKVPSSGASIPPGNGSSTGYLADLVKKQDEARQGEKLGLGTRISDFYGKLKEQLVNAQAPIEDVLTSAERKGKFQVRPTEDIRLQIDRSLRSRQLAGQFLKDSGLVDVIRKTPDLNALDQYMIAKQARAVAANGLETGRNLSKDEQLIHDLVPTYEPFAQQVNAYSRKLLQYSVDSGLISKETANMLITKYPEYVPLNRIFNEDELAANVVRGTGKGVASLSRQTVVQRLKGSERQIENPIASLVQKTQTAFDQGERNIAARQLASYKDLPGNPFNITEVKEGEAGAKTTFSALVDGVKHIYQTTPEVAAAAKSLNKEQMGLLAKIVSIPTRILRLGATGLNYPFSIANLVKDQSTAFINTKNARATATPIAFVKGLFAALGHGKLYEDLVRNAGGGTSWDIGRGEANSTVGEIRLTRNFGGKLLNVLKNPIRTAEDLIGRTEELTRAQQFHGMYDRLIKQGRTPQDARLLAAQAARENTVNFARGGTFSRMLNWAIPYFNAGVQGSRTLVRNMSTRPVQTLSKFAIGVGMPVATATAWNLSDPQRKQAYQDIPDFEKQNSIVIIPPNPTKNADGTWNVWKIPLSQEIASLTALVRRPMEQAAQLDPVKFGEIANALLQAGTSLNTQTPTGLVSSLTPQIAKPGLEAITNKNLFTGRDIVPSSMRNLPPEQQIKKNTSGTARIIGKTIGKIPLLSEISPLIVQNEAQTILGGLGPQLMSAADAILNKFGIIPDNQVSTKDVGSALKRRFFVAQGGEVQNKMDEQLKQGWTPKETQAYDLIHTPRQVDPQGNAVPDSSILNSQQKAILYLNYPTLQATDAIKEQQNPNHDPIWDLPPQWRNVVFASRVQLPNQKNTYDAYLAKQPWYTDFLQRQSTFYDSLPKMGQPMTQTDIPYPKPSAYVQQQMDAKNWRNPEVSAYLDALTKYKNGQLALLGLPPVETGYTRKPKSPTSVVKFGTKKLKTTKLTNLKLKTAKKLTLKLPSMKYKAPKPIILKNKPIAIKLKAK